MSSEAQEQEIVVRYCELKGIPVYHVPNGGTRNRLEAQSLKRQGVKAGVPDLCFPVPKGKYHGMYIEMKYGKNKTTQAQNEWLELLSKNGYMTAVCYGFEEAQAVIDKYFNQMG